MASDPNADLFRENQRLRGRVQGLDDEVAGLKEQLAYAWQEVEYLRGQVGWRALQAAEPVDKKYRNLAPVTAAELDRMLAQLRDVRPLPLT